MTLFIYHQKGFIYHQKGERSSTTLIFGDGLKSILDILLQKILLLIY